MCKVSIIIPIYNASKHINQCIQSLLGQTLKDIEIICIDNCSTDNSVELLHRFKEKDNRIKIIKEMKIGAGFARNEGIRCAKGDYIGFVDADDFVEYDMFEKLYHQALRLNSDIVICDRNIFDDSGALPKKHNDWKVIKGNYLKCRKSKITGIPENTNFTYKYILKTLLVTLPTCWNKIYRTSLLEENDIKFSSTHISEDAVFTLKALTSAKQISYINEYLYNYRKSRNSLSRLQSEKNMDEFVIIREMDLFLESSGLKHELEENFKYYRLSNILRKYKQTYSKNRSDYIKLAQEILDKEEFLIFLKKNCKLKYLKEIIKDIQIKVQKSSCSD